LMGIRSEFRIQQPAQHFGRHSHWVHLASGLMRHVAMLPSALPSRVWRRICAATCSQPKLPASRGAATVCSPRLGPPAHSLGWTPIVPAIPRRCLPRTPPAVGVPRRKPPRDARSVFRGRRSLRGWSPLRTLGWLPALRFVSGGPHASRLSLGCAPEPSRGWGRAGAWTAPRWPRLPRRCGNPPGGGCAFASAQGGGPLRHPPALPRKGASRPLPSAALARKPVKLRSVCRRDAASRPGPSGGLPASLDPATRP
jgi:hypothetical protein